MGSTEPRYSMDRARFEKIVDGRVYYSYKSLGPWVPTDTYVKAPEIQDVPNPPKAVPHDGKDDKGKSNPGLLFEGCAPALLAVTDVLDGGAKKYAANSWQNVPNGIERYKAAFYRHLQEMQVQGWDAVNHDDFGLLHIDHLITDLLFIRTLMHKEQNAI